MGPRFALRAFVLALVAATGIGVALAATNATLKTANNSTLGKIVVSGNGRTLYHLTSEKGKAVKCKGQCLSFWLPVTTKAGAKTVAGAGLTASKLGTVKRVGGVLQVTYAGYPVYWYSGDRKAGDTAGEALPGQGVPGTWYAVSPVGASVMAASAPPPTTTGSTTTTTSGGYGGGPGYKP